MGASEGIFRREALEAKARTSGPGRLLKMSTRTTWIAWALLALGLTAGLAAAASWKVDTVTAGSATVFSNGTVVALVKGGPATSIRIGSPLHLQASGHCPAADPAITSVMDLGAWVRVDARLARPCSYSQKLAASVPTGKVSLLDMMLNGLGI